MMIVLAILGLLLSLMTWLKGRTLSDSEKARINHLLHRMDEFKALAEAKGCSAAFDPEQEQI